MTRDNPTPWELVTDNSGATEQLVIRDVNDGDVMFFSAAFWQLADLVVAAANKMPLSEITRRALVAQPAPWRVAPGAASEPPDRLVIADASGDVVCVVDEQHRTLADFIVGAVNQFAQG